MDDAGVYQISEDIALVQTVDFFFPVVNDPRMNGQIAAANSLSDVWAMGAQAHTAMNVLAYPPGQIPADAIEELLVGGSEKLTEAHVSLVGGHTMEQENVLYGMSVTGTVHPKKIKTNAKARIGDIIILTKPLGTGVYSTAISKDDISDAQYKEVTNSMARLNKYAADVLLDFDVSAMTDVTGFGLLGHSIPIAKSTNATIKIEQDKVPLLSDILTLLEKHPAKALSKTTEYTDQFTKKANNLDPIKTGLFAEAQTSGGLLTCIKAEDAQEAIKRLRDNGDEVSSIIGEVLPRDEDGSYISIVK